MHIRRPLIPSKDVVLESDALRNTLRVTSLLLAGAALAVCVPALVASTPLPVIVKVSIYRAVDFYPVAIALVSGGLSWATRAFLPVVGLVSTGCVLFLATVFRGPWILPGTFGDRYGGPSWPVYVLSLAGLLAGFLAARSVETDLPVGRFV